MKRNFKLSSILMGMLAMIAISTMTLSLTACGSDDDDDPPAKNLDLYRQWRTIAGINFMDEKGKAQFSSAVFDFTDHATYSIYCLGRSDGVWHKIRESAYTVTVNSETTGSIVEKSTTYQYSISGDKMTISWETTEGTMHETFKAVSGIKPGDTEK